MKPELHIHYKEYFPQKALEDFKLLEINKHLQTSIVFEKEDKNVHNFTGPEIATVALYLNQQLTEYIRSGIIGGAAWDTLKAGLKLLWSGLKNEPTKASAKKERNVRYVSIKLQVGDKLVDIQLEGDLPDDAASNAINQAFDFVKSTEFKEALENRNNSEVLGWFQGVLRFNTETQEWYVVDFGDYEARRKKVFEAMSRLSH